MPSIALITASGILLLSILAISAGLDVSKNEPYECAINLKDDDIIRRVIEVNTVVVLCLDDSRNLSSMHIVVQAHVHRGSVMISLDRELLDGRYANGSNVGVISSMSEGDLARWFLVSYVSQNDDRSVSIMAKAYSASDPVPGGCNQELPLKNDPNVYLRNFGPHLSSIVFAYGNSRAGLECGSPESKAFVNYDVYQFFMHERDLSSDYYHKVVKNLLDSSYVRKNAVQVTSLSSTDVTSLKFPAYRGIGTAFIVIMTVTSGNSVIEASYVPTVTYFCDDLENGCHEDAELQSKILVSVLAVVGLFVCFCGHRFFKIEMFFFGVLASMLVAYILLERFSSWSFSTYLYVAIGVGVAGGVIWWLVWAFLGVPQMSVALVALLLGYMLASIVINASLLGIMPWLRLSEFFHPVLFSAVLVPLIISLCATRQINVLSCAIIGSFFVVLAADICLHGVVKYVLLNTIWRSSTPLFVEAFCLLPFQLSDIILYFAWAVIAISGIVVHYFLERDRPSFPQCPWKSFVYSRREPAQRNESESFENDDEDDEHRPLLFNSRRRDSQGPSRIWREQPVEQLVPPEENTTEWWQLPQDSATPTAVPVVSNTNTPPPPYEESEPLVRAV